MEFIFTVGCRKSTHVALFAALFSLSVSAWAQSNSCDLNGDGVVDSADVALAVNMALGSASCTANVESPGSCTVVTVQRVMKASRGRGCNILDTAPSITSPIAASGTVGSPFSYQIKAASTPINYSVSGLPDGLSLDTATGLISGTPTSAGTSAVTMRVTLSNVSSATSSFTGPAIVTRRRQAEPAQP